MELTTTTVIPTALRPAFVAPTLGGSAAGVCPKAGFHRVDEARTSFWAAPVDAAAKGINAENAAMAVMADQATGHRPWSPLIT